MHKKLDFLVNLEGLRAFAVISVMISHWLNASYLFRVPFGHAGVQVFFVLSGFLITRILLNERSKNKELNKSLKTFYIRRTLRIFPLYYLVLALLLAFNVGEIQSGALWHLTYTSNFYNLAHQGWQFPSHFWSLAVEEQFYLVWPLIILAMPIKWLKQSIWFCFLLGLLLRWGGALLGGIRMYSMIPFVNFDALAGGALIAYYSAERVKKLFKTHIWIGLFVTWCSIWLMDNFQISTHTLRAAQHTIMILLFIGIVASLATTKQLKFSSVVFGNSFIRYIGKISYGIYIIHMFAPKFWRWLSQKDFLSQYSDWFVFGWSALFLNLAFTIILAGVSWRIIESPINRLKARFSS